MRVLVSGATGFVGSALCPHLASIGHEVVPLARGAGSKGGVHWDPARREIDRPALEGFDAVIHLASENIGNARWTPEKKRKILESRTVGTTLLCESLAGLARKPRVLLSASAIGFYGDRGETELTEGSAMGVGFLPEVCRDWEAATRPALLAGIRLVEMRIGTVLSKDGGALARMMQFFRFGVGGRVGTGRQWMCWIARTDLAAVFAFALERDDLRGPVNCVAPEPTRNADFTRTLGRVLHRPTPFPAPPFALRLMFGEIADAVLLASARVIPRRLLDAGFPYRFAKLEDALRHELGRDGT